MLHRESFPPPNLPATHGSRLPLKRPGATSANLRVGSSDFQLTFPTHTPGEKKKPGTPSVMADGRVTGAMPSLSTVAASSAVMRHLNASANSTAYSSWLPTSPRELLKLPLHAVYRAEVLTFVTIPRQISRFIGLENMVTGLWEDAAVIGEGDAVAAAAGAANVAAEGAAAAGVNNAGLNFTDIFHAVRRFSGFFSYMTSRWSLACFSVVRIRH